MQRDWMRITTKRVRGRRKKVVSPQGEMITSILTFGGIRCTIRCTSPMASTRVLRVEMLSTLRIPGILIRAMVRQGVVLVGRVRGQRLMEGQRVRRQVGVVVERVREVGVVVGAEMEVEEVVEEVVGEVINPLPCICLYRGLLDYRWGLRRRLDINVRSKDCIMNGTASQAPFVVLPTWARWG